MRQQLKIQNPAAARVFEHSSQRRLLLHLVAREHSLQELSLTTGMTLSLLHYHVKRLCKLELIHLTREVPRRGRPIKYYRATAQSFFVPGHLASDRRTFLKGFEAALEQVFSDASTRRRNSL